MKKTITFYSRIIGPDFKLVNNEIGIAALDAQWSIEVTVPPNADDETIAKAAETTSLAKYPDRIWDSYKWK